jgi:crotonobetainyl-CoA:carnitine CoA-transferase CaiB-like acyl-CoA transferase
VASLTAEEVFHRAQAKGLLWASVRLPEENLNDPHFQARGTFQAIPHAELNRDLLYPASVATDGGSPVTGCERGAPRLGEHTREVLVRLGFSSAEVEALVAELAV